MEGFDLTGLAELDLTKVSATVAYAQVTQLLGDPEAYNGMKLSIKGFFLPALDETGEEPDWRTYCFISDATACCMQMLEFRWDGEHTYPEDYPPDGTEITVTGRFEAYSDGTATYGCLSGASLEWNG